MDFVNGEIGNRLQNFWLKIENFRKPGSSELECNSTGGRVGGLMNCQRGMKMRFRPPDIPILPFQVSLAPFPPIINNFATKAKLSKHYSKTVQDTQRVLPVTIHAHSEKL